jgi:hypothetical protein
MSRNNESDEVFAKRLQNEEYQPKSELTPNLQQLQDEDFARQLAREEQTSTGTQFQLSSGQTAMIRLHHPATALQIGEILLAHFITVDEMVFELAHVPGKYLKVKPSGNVEFSLGRDNEAFFKVGNSPSQSLYLMPKLFLNHWNSKNSRGWYLTMTRQGQLQGNGDRCQLAEWQLVSAAVQLNGLNSSHPPPIPQSAILQEYNNPLLSDVASEGGRSQESGGSGHPNSSRPASYFQAPSSGSAANAKILRGEVISLPPNAHHYGNAVTHQPSLPPMSPLSTSSSSAIAYNQHNSAPTSNHNNIGLSLDAPSFPGYGAGREALMKYFYTDEGFLFLQSVDNQDALRWFLQNGSLSQILHRPDWPIVARRFRHYATESVPALMVENIRSFQSPAQFPIFQQFFQAGYSIVRQEVSPAILQAANKVIQFWTHRYLQQPSPSFSSSFASSSSANVSQNQNGLLKTRYGGVYCVGDICQDVDILALYFESRLPQVTQYLLGSNDVLHPKHAQIRSSFPLLDFTVESPALYGDQWIIEGFTVHGEHSPYSLFLGIALTDFSENDMGNLCVHPESHLLLMDLYKDHARYHRTAFSEDPQSSSRPNLGQPVEICLKAGDAIFCTQRLATLFTNNNSFSTTTMVFFRISHVDHAQLKQAALESPWVEFPLASYYLDSPCNDETQHHGDISDSHKKGDEIVEVNATAISGSEQMTAVAAPIGITITIILILCYNCEPSLHISMFRDCRCILG